MTGQSPAMPQLSSDWRVLSRLLMAVMFLEFFLYPRWNMMGAYVRIADLATLFAFFFFAYKIFRSPAFIWLPRINTVFTAAILAIIVAAGISTLLSANVPRSSLKLVQILERIFLFFWGSWVIEHAPDRRALLKQLIRLIAVSAAFQAVAGLSQYVTDIGGYRLPGGMVRISGFLGNNLSGYLLLGLILSLTAFSSKEDHPGWLLLSPPIAVAIFLTQVRSIWAFSLVFLCVFLIINIQKLTVVLNLIKVLLISVLLFFLLGTVRGDVAGREAVALNEIRNELGIRRLTTMHARLELWSVALKMAVARPFSGIGPGNYGAYFDDPMYATPAQIILFNRLKLSKEIDAHSSFFTNLAEMGGMGILAAMFFWGSLLYAGGYAVFSKHADLYPLSPIAWALGMSFMGYLLADVFGGNLFWLLAGIFVSLPGKVVREKAGVVSVA